VRGAAAAADPEIEIAAKTAAAVVTTAIVRRLVLFPGWVGFPGM